VTRYLVEALIEVEIDNDDLDGPTEAVTQADLILQRAWDTDQGRRHLVGKWHFEIPEDGAVMLAAAGEEV
jgi:hypothetical protein